jgi:threonylcarbamoyladenosine tRNA methylthiotransferase MtaB
LKVAIQTLGCKVNQSESSSIEGILRDNNYEIVKHNDNPDVCIINTCTVTAKSDYQSRQFIRKAVRSGARVIATGCYAQLRSAELTGIEGLDYVIGNSGKNNIINYLQGLKDNNKPFIAVDPPTNLLTSQPYHSTRSRAFLKIQDGCNFSCSYCTVPLARGKSRSLSPQDVLSAVEKLSSSGYKEIVITGIHIGSYGLELQPGSSLLDIVKEITKSYPQVRIRLSSIEPREFKAEFLSLIKDRNVCPHLHIPLQSGSDRILKKMNRGYTTSFYQQLINNIISLCSDISIGTDIITGFPGETEKDFNDTVKFNISIGTDIITGFPGETEKDFNDTVKFIKQLPFSYLHVFPYSKRPNTKASLSGNQVDEKVKQSRVRKLIELGKIMKNTYIKGNLGKTLDVIVEEKNKTNGYYNVISDNYLKLQVKSDNLSHGQRLRAEVISMTELELVAKPLK